ncbi:hypothetical protein NEUTE2DRAFT_55254 [Neurospora tetrasperma FGSC 2509]|nr:hypothetical protein NEUTE2DRAFT_55254 [Neurospora tetrasperma FGSC 2509]
MNPANNVAESLRRLEEEVEQRQSILRLINLPDKTSEKIYTDKVRLLNGLHAVEQLELLGSELLDNFSIDQFGRIQVHTPDSLCKSFAKEFIHVRKVREAREIWRAEGPRYPEHFPWFTLLWGVQELGNSEHPIPETILDSAAEIVGTFCHKIQGMKVLAQKTLLEMQLSEIKSGRISDICHAFGLRDVDWRSIEAHLLRGDRPTLETYVEGRISLSGNLEKFLQTASRVRSILENYRVLFIFGFNPEQS